MVKNGFTSPPPTKSNEGLVSCRNDVALGCVKRADIIASPIRLESCVVHSDGCSKSLERSEVSCQMIIATGVCLCPDERGQRESCKYSSSDRGTHGEAR